MLRWQGTKLKYNHKTIDFGSEILKAGKFMKWCVISTRCKLYFLGDDECALPFDILRVDIHKDKIVYQSRKTMNIYKVTHPYKLEEYIFSSPSYYLKHVLQDSIYVLEKDGFYVIKRKDKLVRIALSTDSNRIEYSIVEIDDGRFYNVEVNSLDDRLTSLSVDIKYDMCVYQDMLVLIYKNTLTFAKFNDGKFRIESPIYLNKQITIVKTLEMNVAERQLYFLQVNGVIFYADSIVCTLSETCSDVYEQAHCVFVSDIAFWNDKSALEGKLLKIMTDQEVIRAIRGRILYGKYNFDIISDCVGLDLALEMEYHESKTFDTFLDKIEMYNFATRSKFVQNLQRLRQNNFGLVTGNDLFKLLNIQYTRLFTYKRELVGKSGLHNMAYWIIYYEQNRQKNSKLFKKCNYKRFYKHQFKDNRMIEVFNLFNEEVRVFELDDNDNEDRREWNYILRQSCNIGKSYCFLYNKFQISSYKSSKLIESELRYLISKGGDVEDIKLKDKHWKDWPSFNLGCASILATSKSINFKRLLNNRPKCVFYLSGMIYGLGLKNKFKKWDFSKFSEFLYSERDVLVMSLLFSFGISNKNTRNVEYEEFCYEIIKTDTSINVKIGALGGLAGIFRNMKNTKLRNIFIEEINKEGIYISDKYNKSNMIVYNKTYKVMHSFNLAKVLGKNSAFVELKNKLCELLVNGLCIYDKKKYKMCLERSKKGPLDEYFYSHLFLEELYEIDGNINDNKLDNGFAHQENLFANVNVSNKNEQEKNCMNKFAKNKKTASLEAQPDKILEMKFETRLNEVKNNFIHFDTWNIYKYAGILFYYGTTCSLDIKQEYIQLLQMIETRMQSNKILRVLFDYLLITLCLFSNSHCNLDLVRIIRRQIKSTEVIRNDDMTTYYKFTSRGISKEVANILTYGDCEKYKMCLGIAALGLCKYKITRTKDTVLDLIATFYINWPVISYEQEAYNFYRYSLLNSIEPIFGTNSKEYFVQKLFKKQFAKLSDGDRKYFIDVLSDYYEHHHNESDYLIDITRFKDIVIRSQ